MARNLILLLFLLAIANVSFGQQAIPLNAHHFEIKDTLTYKPCFYKIIKQEIDGYMEEETYDTNGQLDCKRQVWFEKKKRKLIYQRTVTIKFSPIGDTIFMTDNDILEKVRVVNMYDQGKRFGEAKFKGDSFEKGWKLNTEGERVSISEFRLSPRLKNMEEFYRYLGTELKYPKEARQKGIQGVVYFAFKVDSSGKVTDLSIANPEEVDRSLQEEAIRVVTSFNIEFYPQEDRSGQPVEGGIMLPIAFRL